MCVGVFPVLDVVHPFSSASSSRLAGSWEAKVSSEMSFQWTEQLTRRSQASSLSPMGRPIIVASFLSNE
jgi:hypothetical protein